MLKPKREALIEKKLEEATEEVERLGLIIEESNKRNDFVNYYNALAKKTRLERGEPERDDLV